MTTPSAPDEYSAVAEFYDAVPHYAARPDVAFYVETALTSGGPVLELGCGTGRVLLPIARAGIEIVGVDGSPAMLNVLRMRLDTEPQAVHERVTVGDGDMRRFHLGQQFALALIPFRPFQRLLTVEDQLACLSTIHRHLRDDGRLVFDIFNPSPGMLNAHIGEELADGPEFTMPDGRRVVRKMRLLAHDRFAQVIERELVYNVTTPDGSADRFVHRFWHRNTFRFEMEHLLARAGFEVEHVYADFERNPYGSKHPGELIFVAVRR